jgi:predicted amidohydrolase YtcJ
VYTDHHVHFLATVAASLSINVTSAESIGELVELLRRHGSDGWIRGWGYDECRFIENRHPTRQDLDRVTSDQPLIVHHRTGHVAVLNSTALADLGIPGHLDGILLDQHELLSRVPRLARPELQAAASQVSTLWLSAGVGSFTDATSTADQSYLRVLSGLAHDGIVHQRMTAMVGHAYLDSVPSYGAVFNGVEVGHAKVVPDPDNLGQLRDVVRRAHAVGFPVAVHCVDIDELGATLDALACSRPPSGTRDRIEHNALSLPEQVRLIAAVDARVVVNPSFLVQRAYKYEQELTAVERSWLIRLRSLIQAGIEVRAGTDAPVSSTAPEQAIQAAQSHPFSPEESLDRAQASRLFDAW